MATDRNEKYKMMIESPVERLIIKMAVPTIISMLVTSFYNMADTFFVGRISTQATAAVGVSFSLMAIIQAVGFFFGQGSGNFISRSMGKQDYEQSEQMAATGVISAFLTGVVIMIVGILLLKPLCTILGATQTMLPDTMSYIRIILIGAPFMISSMVLNNQLRFQGSAVYSMIGLCAGAVINCGLDPLLIFVFKMGVAGAAIATIFSQFVGFVLLYIGTLQKSNIRVKIRNFSPCVYYYKEIVRCGLPSLCRQGLNSVSIACVNLVGGFYGDAAIAAMSVVSRVIGFAFSALLGFGQGFQPVCGFNYGAKKYSRVIKAFGFVVKVSSIMLTCFSVLGIIFSPQIIAFFRNDTEVIRIGAKALRFNCISLPLLCLVINGSMLLQNLGKAGRATMLGSVRGGLVLIPVLFFMNALFGITGLQMAQMITDIISFVIAVPIIIGIVRELKTNIGQ